jgi:hypothetical protein
MPRGPKPYFWVPKRSSGDLTCWGGRGVCGGGGLGVAAGLGVPPGGSGGLATGVAGMEADVIEG